MPVKYELVIKGGRVVDPQQGIDDDRDVAITGDRVAAVDPTIDAGPETEVIDARGKLVTPGLIDVHVHVYSGVSHYGIEPDPHCLRQGATTVYDAGSSGADTFAGFKKYVIDVSATRIKAYLHISSQGMLNPDIGELTDLRYADVARAVRMCEENRDDIVGIKIRMSRALVGENGLESLKRAREVCDATGLSLMVHPNGSPVSFARIMDELRAGDVCTHCYHSSDTGILDDDDKVRPEARRAAARGVLFDVGHGQGSFVYSVADAALAQDFRANTISSDLHRYNLHGPVYSLATTASKFLQLGWTLNEVIEKVTSGPARTRGVLGKVGTLKPGACADVAIFELQTGTFEFRDAKDELRIGEQKLVPVLTLRDGKPYAPDDGHPHHPHQPHHHHH
ncbi:MAG: amidohydrolase/deacetylase family metallohydrolase [Phycisphaeraceae bacterium]|nr:amidohydrolase/deacetylase family metallohydrolase [Phycisphaeraceae bacterium]